MGRYAVFLAALGLTTSTLAQVSAAQVLPPTGMPAVQGAGCPVGLFAERRTAAGSAVMLAGDGARGAGRVSLLVGLDAVGKARPMSAVATLHGVAIDTRLMLVNGANVEASESVALAPKQGEQILRRAIVASQRLQGVSWLELTEIRFADGKTWHPTHGVRCTARAERCAARKQRPVATTHPRCACRASA